MNQAAGFWIRLGASLLDGLIVGIPLGIMALILTGGGDTSNLFTNTISFLYTLLLPIFWNGQTIGKRICGIRIRRVDDHLGPSLGTMILRDVVTGVVYGLTFGIGFLVSVCMVIFREDKRSLHDFIAGTEVVHD